MNVGSSVAQLRGRGPRDHLVHQLVRRVHLLPERATRRTAWPRREPRASAGSSATSSTGPRPSWYGSRSRTTSLYRLPDGVSDDAALLLSDILPTGFEIGVQYGQVKPGDTVAVVGTGPVGLAVVATAGLYGAAQIVAIDLDENRLDVSKQMGATHTVELRVCGLEGAGPRPDRRLRRRRRGRSRRRSRDIRHVHPAGTPRRQRRQRRRPWRAGAAGLCRTSGSRTSTSAWAWSTRRSLAMLLKLVTQQKLPVHKLRDAHLQLRRCGLGLRDVRQRRADPGAQGDDQPLRTPDVGSRRRVGDYRRRGPTSPCRDAPEPPRDDPGPRARSRGDLGPCHPVTVHPTMGLHQQLRTWFS